MYAQPTSDTWAARKIPAWKRKCRTRAISNLKWDGANSLPREFAEPNWTWILQRLNMIILNSQSDDFRFSWTCFTLFLFFCNQIKLVSPSKRMIWPQEFQCGKMSIVETTHGLSNEHTIGSTFEQIYESHPNGTLHGANGLASAASRICRSRWHPRVMTRTPTTMTSPTRRMSPSPPWPQLGAIVATPRAAAAAKKMRPGPLAVMILLGLWCELWWWWVFLWGGGIGDHSLGQNLSLIV